MDNYMVCWKDSLYYDFNETNGFIDEEYSSSQNYYIVSAYSKEHALDLFLAHEYAEIDDSNKNDILEFITKYFLECIIFGDDVLASYKNQNEMDLYIEEIIKSYSELSAKCHSSVTTDATINELYSKYPSSALIKILTLDEIKEIYWIACASDVSIIKLQNL